jgi:hypothetical protein
MTKAIRDSGFTPVPEDVTMTVTGTLQVRDGSVVLALDQMKEPKSLICIGEHPGDSFEKELAQNAGHAVEVRGLWVFDGKGGLQVTKMERTSHSP